ncbi:hypothetical protein KC207_02775 [Phycicoccus sp. BSK3Z-2]|uniref:DUF3806 domain-containing protein n=1 Tax=Phycicoccus avicenniae TaxID=2828860 RepID=A0A941D826_9MICO|nr:DUF3806 domain-containing protein [Phycicoccus avicenniae]MBR7742217.1 hypothetical protein [Phycicoccus avicenniae]
MGLLDRWRSRAEDEEPASPDTADVDPVEEVRTRPLDADEEARLEAYRLRYPAHDIDPGDLASIHRAWEGALDTAPHDAAAEIVTVVSTAIGDHLVGHGYRWVVSTDPYGTDLAVEPPRRGVPVVVRTLVAVRWMSRQRDWVDSVVGHLVRSAQR